MVGLEAGAEGLSVLPASRHTLQRTWTCVLEVGGLVEVERPSDGGMNRTGHMTGPQEGVLQ